MAFAGWNYGDLADAVASVVPGEAPALIHGDRVVDWASFDRRTNALARGLAAAGVKVGDKIAMYMRNCPEYMEATFAGFKGRFTHVNVNYRYLPGELHYIFENSDAAAVFFTREFAPALDQIRDRLPLVKAWVVIEDGTPAEGAHAAPFAVRYEDVLAGQDGGRMDIARSPDDLFFIYTGGTTGMPKGVMWRHDDLRRALMNPALMPTVPEDVAQTLDIIRENGRPAPSVPACPLMHGTGLLTGMTALVNGGAALTLTAKNFDPVEMWDAVHRHKAGQLVIVGDAFCRPMNQALDANPGRWDLSSILTVVSSGIMWSTEVKRKLLDHLPQATLLDSFGASEAVGFGLSIMTAAGEVRTAKFQIGPGVKVLSPEGREIAPGSGEPGFVARFGPIPLGYYKDEEKTAKTFPVYDGVRYSVPGDWCTVEADGTLTLMGRGSVCINTGGEKVYPEEVEEVLKTAPGVEDALVVGVPDEKWGQAVTGVVEMKPGARFDEEGLRQWVRERLAGYKTPKRIVTAGNVSLRAPNGKADYKGVTTHARSILGVPA